MVQTAVGKFQAYEILAAADGISSGTIRLTDWVAPTAVADQTTGAPVAGFSGIPMFKGTVLKKSDAALWAEAKGSWEFVYIAGMLTFEPGFTPQDKDATNGKTSVTLTAFKYVGDYLTDTLANIDTVIANSKEIATVDVLLADGTATPATTGKTITSVVSEAGVVTMTINAEVLSVKQGTEEINPDLTYAAGITTITADYGTLDATAGLSWTLTYRI